MSAETAAVVAFLAASILLYVLLGGADFGAGIVELFATGPQRDGQRELVSHAMAPVWEANHVWLILAVVILFVGFPAVYTQASVFLHLPLLAVLVGIVARGAAFTFRHYDPERQLHRSYTLIFTLSSVWTAFFLGVTAGAMFLGHLDPRAPDFPSLYLDPWLNLPCLAQGLFTTALFGLLASVYLSGEAPSPVLRRLFLTRAARFAVAVVVLGAFTFAAAERDGAGLVQRFFTRPLSIAAFVVATLLWVPFWRSLTGPGHPATARLWGAGIVTLVLLGWFAVQWPYALRTPVGGLTLVEAAAPESTMRALLAALVVGAVLIFPALGYLLRVFKWDAVEKGKR